MARRNERFERHLVTRREILMAASCAFTAPVLAYAAGQAAIPRLRVAAFDLLPVRATSRTVWLIVRLRTDTGLTGLGEASDAFGFANTTSADAAAMRAALQTFFTLVEHQSPLDIQRYRKLGMAMARKGLVEATAFSAIEQALWDLAGKALNVPTHVLLGGKLHDSLPVYANVNRATNPRTPQGFASAARRAVADGFTAVKAAPFDGFPAAGSPASQIEAAVQGGIDAVVAIREAVGSSIDVMIDCHSFFDVDLAVRVAQQLEAQRLAWYEEPVAPENVDDTLAIKSRIRQPMAGGELLFGIAGFDPLIRRRAFDIIMPDVKHCGGLLELTHVAAVAASEGVLVAPHNPSGPVSTAASAQVCAGLGNANFLELQYGEVGWRSEVLSPPEQFVRGSIQVSNRPGFGVELNETAIRARALPL